MNEKLTKFFDKLEDQTRAKLSRAPILYAFLGGIGVVLFWRGVWHLADEASINSFLSLLIGSLILLITGIFVSAFVGNRLILSGLSGEKKLAEKTEDEIKSESNQIENLENILKRVEKKVSDIESEISQPK